MPTQTFWNLPEEKRQALLDIAIEEFADNEYAHASISRIVARAGIAKGSIYQYFEDKQDLFLYLLDLSNQTRLDFIRQESLPLNEQGFFAALRRQMSASTRAALAYPRLTRLAYRAHTGALPFQEEVNRRSQALASEYLRDFVQQGIDQGAIAPDVDLDMATFVIEAVITQLGPFCMARFDIDIKQLADEGAERFATAEIEQCFDQLVRILERGMGDERVSG
jgi:AcrR family transcriptional regulator